MGSPVVVRFREFDANGDPLSGGKLYSYEAGTTTKKATFSDPDCTTPNTNPVVLDAEGYADVWIASGSYKFQLTDSLDVPRWVRDDITGGTSGGGSEGGGVAPMLTYVVTDGQAAADLETETIDFASFSSLVYECEIRRGTTVAVNGPMAIQNLDGVGRVLLGSLITEELHGLEFTLSQVGTVAQLRVSASTGPGDGTVKLSRRLIPA